MSTLGGERQREVVTALLLAARRLRDHTETRAVTVEAELKHSKLHLGKELEQARDELLGRLEEAQAAAERRVEEHTEEYRLQVHTQSCPGSQVPHCTAAAGEAAHQHQ